MSFLRKFDVIRKGLMFNIYETQQSMTIWALMTSRRMVLLGSAQLQLVLFSVAIATAAGSPSPGADPVGERVQSNANQHDL